MNKIRKILLPVMLSAMAFYAVKKHTDTAADLASSLGQAVVGASDILRDIDASSRLLGFPRGGLEILSVFQERFPEEKTYFMSDRIRNSPQASQRTIEFNFPKVPDAQAKCGFFETAETVNETNFLIVERNGDYQLVCRR